MIFKGYKFNIFLQLNPPKIILTPYIIPKHTWRFIFYEKVSLTILVMAINAPSPLKNEWKTLTAKLIVSVLFFFSSLSNFPESDIALRKKKNHPREQTESWRGDSILSLDSLQLFPEKRFVFSLLVARPLSCKRALRRLSARRRCAKLEQFSGANTTGRSIVSMPLCKVMSVQ